MRVAFVGVKRKYQELAPEYRDFFNQFHLELPYYFARHGPNDVTITTVDYSDYGGRPMPDAPAGSSLVCQREDDFVRSAIPYDVVVHWRKWFPEFYRPEAINVINCQDHSFSPEWVSSVRRAFDEKKLYGILCFPTWHKRNLAAESGLPEERLIDGLTLGVDTSIYAPSADKDPHQLLWASDPGRGLHNAIVLAIRLFQMDHRYRLNICYPDYARAESQIKHPALVWHGNVSNGPKLWNMFNRCGVLPYPSTFQEPSSRAHRQAQAAGSLVLYPRNMGSPSELIKHGETGIVSEPTMWADTIHSFVETGLWKEIGARARLFAESEDWNVQAKRFTQYFERILGK